MENKKEENRMAGHRKRLREKFLDSGLTGFHDYEIIELLLTIGTPRKNCRGIAREVMDRFRTIPAVMEAPSRELMEIKGIGPANVFGIKLIKAVAERYLESKIIHKDPINNSKDLFDYLYLSMKDKTRECFKVIFLDARNRVLRVETLFEGSLTTSPVYPREVIRAAIRNDATALIFSHNHPSGDPEPSGEDITITKLLLFSCRMLEITVHEHIIIGNKKYFSFADNGYIARMHRDYEHWMKNSVKQGMTG